MSRLTIAVLLLVAACSKSDPPSASSASGSGTAAGSVVALPPAADAAPSSPPLAIDAAPEPSPSAIDAGAGAPTTSGPVVFDDLSKDEQVKYMRTKVVPAMKREFQAYDIKEFGKFNCKTCHGKGALTKEYDMPNPDLPELDFAELQAGEHAHVAKFMKEQVTPMMAELLGEAPRTPTNPDGFGCLHCHVEKK